MSRDSAMDSNTSFSKEDWEAAKESLKETSNDRYTLKLGAYGAYFRDEVSAKDLTLEGVLQLLNAAPQENKK